ncbi:hypothetical protein FQN54_003239 [Arachnomyces sp. PD_36]|nr:hypothetical protein FQN54_003239 [Arachnomyces sp. PD_36]
MSPPLPSSFLGIEYAKDAPKGSYVSIMGIVVDMLPPSQSRGSSFVSTFTLMDSNFDRDPWHGFKVKFFRDREAELPSPKLGDAVQIRKIKVSWYQGSKLGVSPSGDNISWTIFSQSLNQGMNMKSSSGAFPPTSSEKAYVASLLNHDGSAPSQQSRTPPAETPTRSTAPTPGPGKSQKFSLIKDVTMATFVDLVAQVVKTYYEGDRHYLYVTDYTSNKALFDYSRHSDESGQDGDEYGYTSCYKRRWQGPFGQLTLQVTLWEPHSHFARQNVKVDDFVLLRNVHIKTGHDGVLKLEGAMHSDRHFPSKVSVTVLDPDSDNNHLTAVVRRKLEYWKGVKAENARLNNGLENSKRKSDGGGNLSANQRKKQKTKENKQRGQSETIPSEPTAKELNKNVRVQYPAIRYLKVSEILHNESHNNTTPEGVEYRLPFQNVRYRSRLRIVDFFPHKLEDFAVQYKKDYDYLSDVESDDDQDGPSQEPDTSMKWEWRFCLLVEDGISATSRAEEPKERIQLMVARADAEFLLNMDAVDLKNNPDVLSQLREKLFLLWGNLEEVKNATDPENFNPDSPKEPITAKPFPCCIKEYGVKSSKSSTESSPDEEDKQDVDDSLGWERRFAMFGTTIAD